MHNVADAVERYLRVESDYSLLINGKWGVGKTYYLKNIVFPRIKNTDTLKNANKKYLPIYASLFGINSVADLEQLIFTEAFSFLKSPAGKKVGGLAKAVARGYLEYKVFGDLDKHLKDLGIEKFPVKKYDDIVVCLDDLERKGNGLTIQELAGYVNHLCDGYNIKIILVMNEEGVGKAEGKLLKQLKEKVIGVQVDFIHNFTEVFESVVNNTCSGFQRYQSFLKENFKFFSQFNKEAGGNLRTVKYVIQMFQPVFSELHNHITGYPAKKDLNEVIESELPQLLKFALTIGIEFRHSTISYSDRHGLGTNLISRQILKAMNLVSKGDEVSYKDEFMVNYYKEGNFKFYESIFAQIVGGPSFQLSDFKKELEGFYGVTDDVVPPQYAVIRRISPPTVYDLSDEEYDAEIQSLYRFAKTGAYKIGDYLLIFELLTCYDHTFDVGQLIAELKQGIDISIGIQHSDEQYNQRIIARSPKHPAEYDDLSAYINNYKKQHRTTLNQKNFDRLKHTFYTAPSTLISLLDKDPDLRVWEHSPFLSIEIFDEFRERFDNYSSRQISDLIDFFSVRYANEGFNIYFQDERPFFEKLSGHIKSRLERPSGTLSSGRLMDLSEQIENILGE